MKVCYNKVSIGLENKPETNNEINGNFVKLPWEQPFSLTGIDEVCLFAQPRRKSSKPVNAEVSVAVKCKHWEFELKKCVLGTATV